MIIYLYIKQHSKTGLKYFGKTTKSDPYSYPGSGVYWTKHIKKHGKEFVETKQVWEFQDIDEASKFAIQFSNENKIAESTDWANLIPENAKDGYGTPDWYTHSDETKLKIKQSVRLTHSTEEVRNKISKSLTGRKISESHRANVAKASSLRTHSEKTKLKISESKKGKKHSVEARQRMSEAAKRRSKSVSN